MRTRKKKNMQIDKVIIEFGGNDMNHMNADPDKDDENN
jgi:hypothetical protein